MSDQPLDEVAGQLADDLGRLLAGQMTEREFREVWQRRDSSAVVAAVWGNLEHYLADADIRAKDAAYRDMQDAELARLIRLLRDGGSGPLLRAISFLGPAGR